MLAWISNEVPDVRGGGGQRRQYHQVRALAEAGVPLTAVLLESGQDDASISSLVPVVRFKGSQFRGLLSSPDLGRRLRERRIERAIVAHIDTYRTTRRALRDHRIPFAVDFQNVLSREPGASPRIAAEERQATSEAALASTVSDEEASSLRSSGGRCPVVVARNGVEPDEWPEPPPIDRQPPVVAVFGTLTHPPSADGAVWMATEVWPLVRMRVPEAELHVMGPGEPPEVLVGQPGVVIRGRVERLAEALGTVRAVAVPITWGIGARVKFIEGLASGRPVVSTTLGAEGYPAVAGAFQCADGALGFADACAALLADAETGSRLGARGRAAAFEHYTWQATTRPLIEWARAAAH